MHRDYQRWCRAQGCKPLDFLAFHERMAGELVREIGPVAVFEQPGSLGATYIYRGVDFAPEHGEKGEQPALRVVQG